MVKTWMPDAFCMILVGLLTMMLKNTVGQRAAPIEAPPMPDSAVLAP